jgi:hypothetical protein
MVQFFGRFEIAIYALLKEFRPSMLKHLWAEGDKNFPIGF